MIPILSFLCCHRSCFHWPCTAADQCTDGALQFPAGVCGVLQYPAHRYHSFWFFNKNVSAVGAKVCFTFHIVAYVIAKFLFGDLNFLYIHSVLFFLDILVMWGLDEVCAAGRRICVHTEREQGRPHTVEVSQVRCGRRCPWHLHRLCDLLAAWNRTVNLKHRVMRFEELAKKGRMHCCGVSRCNTR